MTTRIYVSLEPEERAALDQLAQLEIRPLRDQIRVILREYIKKQGLLSTECVGNQIADQKIQKPVCGRQSLSQEVQP